MNVFLNEGAVATNFHVFPFVSIQDTQNGNCFEPHPSLSTYMVHGLSSILVTVNFSLIGADLQGSSPSGEKKNIFKKVRTNNNFAGFFF